MDWILYVGDYDPAGTMIDMDIERKMRRYLDGLEWQGSLRFERVAVNAGQVGVYGLPTKPRKVSELRRPEIQETVEAEAMPAGLLRGLVRNRIERFLPTKALDSMKAIERIERHDIAARLRGAA